MALSITGGDGSVGSQANTQSPQSATAPASAVSGSAARGGSVQPGTTTSLLTSQNGISLSGGGLSTVRLGGSDTDTQTSVKQPAEPQPTHHFNPALMGFSAALLLLALVMFLVMRRSAKITTE